MSQDSLGKKTHLPNVLRLFEHVDDIWRTSKAIDLRQAARTLEESSVIKRLRKLGIPTDPRAQQAYVKRFFRFLQLPKAERAQYPTVILSVADSVALRQCLFIDWAFNTSEAPEALDRLSDTLAKQPVFELSPKTHKTFCRWIGVDPAKDNTRRGPFARWLEDVGLAAPVPDRGGHETSVLVTSSSAATVCPEAVIYGLMLEFCGYLDGGKPKPTEIPLDKVNESRTVRTLLLPQAELVKLLNQAVAKSYASTTRKTLRLDPKSFSAELAKSAPWPSADWIDDSVSVYTTISPDLASLAISFPPDDCGAVDGDPFDKAPKMRRTTSESRSRSSVFRKRVGAAYRFTCAVTGKRLRSPYETTTRYYGDAAHIIPHSGFDKSGKEVYGKDVVSNGIYLDSFLHWCFDSGWITFEPVTARKKLDTYRLNVATIAAEDGFESEFHHFSELDGKKLKVECLPANQELWPSVAALEWHRDNVFADARL